MTITSNASTHHLSFLRTKERSPFYVVCFCFLLLIGELAALVICNPVFYRDSATYISLVQFFKVGAYSSAFPVHLPVLYTAFSGVFAKLGLSSETALLLVSGIFTSLTVFPLYGFLKKLLSPAAGAVGVVLFLFFSSVLHTGLSPLTDSVRIFFSLCALYLIFDEDATFHPSRCLLLAVTYAGLCLGRGEGLILSGIFVLIHFIFCLRKPLRGRTMFRSVTAALFRSFLPFLLMILLCLPRLMQVYHETGCPAFESRQSTMIKSVLNATGCFPSLNLADKEVSAGGVFSTEYHKDPKQQKRYWNGFLSGFGIFAFPFTVIGTFLLFRRKRLLLEYSLLLTVFLLYNAALFLMMQNAGRYFTLNFFLLLPAAVTGVMETFVFCRKLLERYFSAKVLRTVFIILLFAGLGIQIARGLRNLDSGDNICFKTAGKAVAKLKSASWLERGEEYPAVLLLGTDWGLGCYSGVNTVSYSSYPRGLSDKVSFDDAVKNGISPEHAGFWQTREIPKRIMFDAVAIVEDSMSLPTDHPEWFQEIVDPQTGFIRLYTIQVPHAPGQ